MGDRLNSVRRTFEPLLRRIFHAYFLLVRGMTLGVRAVVLDADTRVFLVRHSYITGWYLPGGGVDFGETMEQAMRRELKEEGDIDLTGDAVLHGIFLNSHVSRRDHVAVYVVRQFKQDRLPEPNHEIVECGFFAINALPEGTTHGTRQRLAEVLDGKPPTATWR
jgi:8-oxo-dGTP pyrophosphatase MutT (NUDIX family)